MKTLQGPKHKQAPSPETYAFKECLAWQDMSCCTVNVSHSIHHHRSIELYNYHWDKCGPISSSCERFLKVTDHYFKHYLYYNFSKDLLV